MLTVLRGMQSKKKADSASFSDTPEKSSETTPFPEENICVPVELFQILAVCEKAKMSRRGSLDESKRVVMIADNIGAAVAATNALPLSDRVLTFHYNRQSPKRRRLITPVSLNSSASIIKHLRGANDKIRVDCDEKIKQMEDGNRGLVLALEEANDKVEN
ncbi:hypothetical protein RYX36_009008 [Vicia faba]